MLLLIREPKFFRHGHSLLAFIYGVPISRRRCDFSHEFSLDRQARPRQHAGQNNKVLNGFHISRRFAPIAGLAGARGPLGCKRRLPAQDFRASHCPDRSTGRRRFFITTLTSDQAPPLGLSACRCGAHDDSHVDIEDFSSLAPSILNDGSTEPSSLRCAV